jgi:DNA topoisomerase I
MSTSLVIVESPAKARTIGRYLGDDFVVEASIGAVRDLDPKGLAVDIEADFKPSYVVPPEKRDVVKRLRQALADADALYLATDEDREGEAIAWHLTEVLEPDVPVRRMVFHEITREAIESAIRSPRDIDQGLVDAQEARRIVDRLFGYPVSEVLWRKISRGLSAGRVQSPAVRLVVERERERMAFEAAEYWGIEATFPTDPAFVATLATLGAARVATGKDFDNAGRLTRSEAVALDEASAHAVVQGLAGAGRNGAGSPATATEDEPWTATADFTVTAVDEKPYRSSPKAPFITSTLQQEGGRKLRMAAREVMRYAQGLYERGYITYMRTDSTTLSDEAIAAARAQIDQLYGSSYVPDRPRVYRSKVRNAQEAHEAIRPAGNQWRTPQQLQTELRGPELRLYELIWKRTLASQMADATGQTVTVRLEAPVPSAALAATSLAAALELDRSTDAADETVVSEWTASGRTISFPGYLRVYVEGSDDPDADLDDRERLLPSLAAGNVLPAPTMEAKGHHTQPPARYTEASLVRRLEELGIGRPSTYASIMQTIQDRGYVWRRGQALLPSWTAFAVMNLLEGHFSAEVDYSFTARMEDNLDQIAVGRRQRGPFLREFWFGDGQSGRAAARDATSHAESSGVAPNGGGRGNGRHAEPDGGGTVGLTTLIDLAKAHADPAVINAIPLGKDPDGEEIEVRNGRYGPFVRRGEDTASVPADLAPDELTVERALELLAAPKGDEPLGSDPASGLPVYVKSGRYGPYVQLGDVDTLPEGQKPKMVSLLRSMSPTEVSLDDALRLLSLPRVVGADPDSGEEITAQTGRYGPYLRKGSDSRSLDSEEQIFTVTLEEALARFAEPKRRGPRAAATPPLKELGSDPVSGKPVTVRDGRYGPYVTDGETNASLREQNGDTVEGITLDRAAELLQARRDAGPARRRSRPTKKKAAKKTAAKAKAKTKAKKRAATKKTGGRGRSQA